MLCKDGNSNVNYCDLGLTEVHPQEQQNKINSTCTSLLKIWEKFCFI